MERKSFRETKEGTEKAPWLYHHGYVDQPLRSERYYYIDISSFYPWNLTRIFKEGSASARRPAVIQAVAPPEPIQEVSTIATLPL